MGQVFNKFLCHLRARACVLESSRIGWDSRWEGCGLEERLFDATRLTRAMRCARLENATPPLRALLEVCCGRCCRGLENGRSWCETLPAATCAASAKYIACRVAVN